MLRSLASLVLGPLNFFYLLLFLGLVFYYFQYLKTAPICWVLAAFWMLTISVSPVPAYLAQVRENRFSVLSTTTIDFSETKPVHILVLGAGHTDAQGYYAFDRLSEPALKRLLEGIRLYHELPNSKLFCSGYSSRGETSQAETLAEAALMLGVSVTDTLLQPTAINTEMEARNYSKRFGDEYPLIVVTSALHMPRAVFWFRHYGLAPIPAPTNHLVMDHPDSNLFSFETSIQKINITAKLLHEYAGMLYAYLTTR
jgi:uncharacterized SAM-binding protein YcdF (DUF218 family)